MSDADIKKVNHDIMFNIAIISWLFIPLFLLFFLSLSIVIQNQMQFHTIAQQMDIQNITHVIGSGSSLESNFPIVIALIAAFFIYCYFFDLIQRKGASIYQFEDQNLKFIGSADHLFILSAFGLALLVFLDSNFFVERKSELMFISILGVIYLISLILYLELRKYLNTYIGLTQLNELINEKYSQKVILSNKKAFIQFIFEQFDSLSSFIFILTFLTLFITFKLNFNILSIILIETILLQIHLIYSSIRLSPKKLHNIKLKSNEKLESVFILSESPKGYYSVLYPNDEIKFIMKDAILDIFPIQKIKEPLEFKLKNAIDEFVSNKDLIYITIYAGIFWGVGGMFMIIFSIFLPQILSFIVIMAIIVITSFLLRSRYSKLPI
jgi:hypothetical protein